MIEQIAKALFAKGAAERVIACVMTKDRAHMHLDTVFTLLDRDKATAYPKVVDGDPRDQPAARREDRARSTSRPEKDFLGAVADALGVPKLHVVETGGDAYQQEREQWDDGNNVVALEPGVVVAYERNTYTIAKMREAGVEVVDDRGLRARQGPRRRALHDLPDRCATRSEQEPRDDGTRRWVVALIAIVASWLSSLSRRARAIARSRTGDARRGTQAAGRVVATADGQAPCSCVRAGADCEPGGTVDDRRRERRGAEEARLHAAVGLHDPVRPDRRWSRSRPGSSRPGTYDYNDDGTPIPGTYHEVDPNPQRIIIDSLMAPINGLYGIEDAGRQRSASTTAASCSAPSTWRCSSSSSAASWA